MFTKLIIFYPLFNKDPKTQRNVDFCREREFVYLKAQFIYINIITNKIDVSFE